MFPLRDDNPTRTTPIVTIFLIVLNVAVFLYQWLVIGLDVSAVGFGLIPAELTRGADLLYSGRRAGLPPGLQVHNLDPAWLTIFTSMFMHGGWMHLLGNMWFLWIFGNNIEDALGKTRFVLFYLACGVGAALTQVVLGPGSSIPMVGASGAIAGVLGAYVVLFPGSRVLCLVTMLIITTVELPASLVLGFWFFLQFISGIGALGDRAQGGVAFAAHVGGFIAGWLLVRVFAAGHRPPPRRHQAQPDFMEWR